eukprot:Platyproteum_vivax@DN2857_c0_g1_i1.p1
MPQQTQPKSAPLFHSETFKQILKDLKVLINLHQKFDKANPVARSTSDREKHERLMLITKDAQKGNAAKDQANEQLSKSMKLMLNFFEETVVDASSKRIVDGFLAADVMATLIKHVRCLDFMNEKRTIDSFKKLCVNYEAQIGPYIKRTQILPDLLKHMDDLWVNQGARSMLESLCQQKSLVTMTLDAVAVPVLAMGRYDRLEEVGTALQGLRCMLSFRKDEVAIWLNKNYNKFFGEMELVLTSVLNDNDAAGLFVFQVLEEILTSLTENVAVARRYCDDAKACDLLLKILTKRRQDTCAIGTFNTFKFFVCFEPRSAGVQKLLASRKPELVQLISGLQKQKALKDPTFREDKMAVLTVLETIKNN